MLKVFETVQAAYAFVWRERSNFISLAGLIVVAAATVSAIGKSVSQNESYFDALLLLVTMLLTAALLQLLFAIVWHRRYLVPSAPTTFIAAYRSGLQQHRFIVLALIAGFFLSAIATPLSMIIALIPNIVDPEHVMFRPLSMLKVWLLFLPLGVLFARLSLMFPAAAVGRHLSMSACWRATTGQTWPLFLTLVLTLLPASLADWLIGDITEGLVKLAGFSNVIEGYAGELVYQFFTFVAIATTATALSIIYTAKVQPEAVQAEGPVELTRPMVGHGYGVVSGLIATAFLVGMIIGGLSLIAGFFGGFLIYPDENLGPLLGFMVAPIAFLFGSMLGLLWNLRKAAKLDLRPRLAYFAFLAIFLVGSTTGLKYFYPFQIFRIQVMDMLPSQVKWLAAPGGVLKIWLVGVPADERKHIRDKKLPTYVGGPLSNPDLSGGWDARFVDAADFIKLYRQERARGQGPDIIVGKDKALFTELLANTAVAQRLPEVHHFSYRSLGQYAYADRDSKNFELARSLALSNDYCWGRGSTSASLALKTELGQLPKELAVAFLTDDINKLANFTDPQDLVRVKEFKKRLRGRPQIHLAKFCQVWGNTSLAITEGFVNFESNRSIGRMPVYLEMYKTPSGWRLRNASDTCKPTIRGFTKTIPIAPCK